MQIELFDTHTHLDSKDFDQDREQVIQRAYDAGVTRFLTVGAGNGFESAANAIKLAESYDFIWASAGVHPHDAKCEFNPQRIKELSMHPRVRAVGETGLDFFRDWSPRKDQERWFEAHIAVAKEVNKPLIIHSREAGLECYETLKRTNAQDVGGVFHCYAENAEFAKKLLDINFLVSFPGVLSFKKAESLRETAQAIPIEQIMLETDAPYLAPVPFRGKRCESSFMVETAKVLAEIKNLDLSELARITTSTACKFFGVE